MTAFTIEHDIPMPEATRNQRTTKYPFSKMNVGDSFTAAVKAESLVASARAWAKRQNNGFKFSVRPEGSGARLWRVE